jgi:hypothetical protein
MSGKEKSSLAIFGGPKSCKAPMPPRMTFFDSDHFTAIEELFKHYKARKIDFGYQDTYEKKVSIQ